MSQKIFLIDIKMKEEYPKDRIDLILSDVVEEDIKSIMHIAWKYRGIEKSDELQHCLDKIYWVLRGIKFNCYENERRTTQETKQRA